MSQSEFGIVYINQSEASIYLLRDSEDQRPDVCQDCRLTNPDNETGNRIIGDRKQFCYLGGDSSKWSSRGWELETWHSHLQPQSSRGPATTNQRLALFMLTNQRLVKICVNQSEVSTYMSFALVPGSLRLVPSSLSSILAKGPNSVVFLLLMVSSMPWNDLFCVISNFLSSSDSSTW